MLRKNRILGLGIVASLQYVSKKYSVDNRKTESGTLLVVGYGGECPDTLGRRSPMRITICSDFFVGGVS